VDITRLLVRDKEEPTYDTSYVSFWERIRDILKRGKIAVAVFFLHFFSLQYLLLCLRYESLQSRCYTRELS
jgi:hypothetical protein